MERMIICDDHPGEYTCLQCALVHEQDLKQRYEKELRALQARVWELERAAKGVLWGLESEGGVGYSQVEELRGVVRG